MLYPFIEHTLNGDTQEQIAIRENCSPASASVRMHQQRIQLINHPANAKLRDELRKCRNAWHIRQKKDLWRLAVNNASGTVLRRPADNAIQTIAKIQNRTTDETTRRIILESIDDTHTIYDIAYQLGKASVK